MKKYWKTIEVDQTALEVQKNRKPGLPGLFDGDGQSLKTTRRDFMKLFGFSIGVAAIASACEQPVQKAIPYLIKPENITPGKASYFASTFFKDNQYCSILVKVRDGRPVKIEGNELSPLSQGGTTARVQASILSVYDTHRFKNPTIDGNEVTWDEIDSKVTDELDKLKRENKKLVILTSSVISPSTKAALQKFVKKYPDSEVISYDAVSASGIIEANKIAFDKACIPSYYFEKADMVLSFGADFLGTWIDPVGFTKGYSKKRKIDPVKKTLSKHIQFESGMSLTGSNADERIQIKPSEEILILANLYNEVAKKTGNPQFGVQTSNYNLDKTVEELLKNNNKSIVISGSNDVNTQLVVNAINQVLGNYGNTIDLSKAVYTKQGIDANVRKLINELGEKSIGGLIVWDANPSYNIAGFDTLIKDIPFTLSLSSQPDETTKLTKYICPESNFLESWNDYEPVEGEFSLAQPVVAPIFKTRQAQESLLKWAGIETAYFDFIKEYWEENIFSKTTGLSFRNFWNKSLQDGYFSSGIEGIKCSLFDLVKLDEVFGKIKPSEYNGIELSFYEKTGLGSGEMANIPWLQEMPDPVSKATWDNYCAVSPKFAAENNLKTGDVVKINNEIIIPVYIQPGQTYNTLSIALGYGRTNGGIIANGVGVNVYQMVNLSGDTRKYNLQDVSFEKTPGTRELAITQTHHSMEGRAIIREASLEEYIEDETAGNEMHEEAEKKNVSLYKQRTFPGHHWGMAIDLNSCTGCGACVVGCQAENNIPVVGRNEVKRVHEMHWIRIDRYYSGNEENPEVVRQPVMCQHCDNAPCENVCPVAATNHSSEGLNQMVYNRCIGTRYCNNNCPYKVRRFNYFDFTGADAIKGNEYDKLGMTLDLPRMVLNPDVTVRAKGVIEKCSFCVQRIQEKKLNAKLDGRKLQDGEIRTACEQACPADAIVFGDLNDPESKVSEFYKNKRNYHLLEEIHTLPSVGYLTKIRNRETDKTEKASIENHSA